MGLWKCVAYMAILGLLTFPAGRVFKRMNLRWDRGIFRTRPWERGGATYERMGIRRWKDLVPDVSKVFPRIVPRKAIGARPGTAALEDMLAETCVAELVHLLLPVPGLALLWLWPGMGGAIVYFLYVMVGNLPFIVIQRYNRPRFARLLAAAAARERRRMNAGSDTVQ